MMVNFRVRQRSLVEEKLPNVFEINNSQFVTYCFYFFFYEQFFMRQSAGCTRQGRINQIWILSDGVGNVVPLSIKFRLELASFEAAPRLKFPKLVLYNFEYRMVKFLIDSAVDRKKPVICIVLVLQNRRTRTGYLEHRSNIGPRHDRCTFEQQISPIRISITHLLQKLVGGFNWDVVMQPLECSISRIDSALIGGRQ